MTDLTEANIEALLTAMNGDTVALNPGVIIIPHQMWLTAGRMAFYKPPVRKVSGARKRKLALCWR